MRNLRYVVVEIGKCVHCFKDAGNHGIDGVCGPMSDPKQGTWANTPRSCFRGEEVYAFLDMDAPEVKALLRDVLEVGVP